MRGYFTNRLQRCKINNSFNEWEKVLPGIPKGAVLGSLLFNIFINDIFLFLQKCDLANYADDSTMYTSNKSISLILSSLSHEFTVLSKWFYNNFIVPNPDIMLICYLVLRMNFKLTYCVGMNLLKTVNNKKYQLLPMTTNSILQRI